MRGASLVICIADDWLCLYSICCKRNKCWYVKFGESQDLTRSGRKHAKDGSGLRISECWGRHLIISAMNIAVYIKTWHYIPESHSCAWACFNNIISSGRHSTFWCRVNQLFCTIVKEVCLCIINVLLPRCIRLPNSRQEIEEEIEGFWRQAGFPQVVEAVDGCHTAIIAPEENADDFVNRKGFHSVFLQGLVDSDYLFSWHMCWMARTSPWLTNI